MTLSLTYITFDCADAKATAEFWSAALERPIADGATSAFATLDGGAPGWMFIQVPEPKSAKNRMHADLTTSDLDAELTRLKGLGATHLADHDEDGTRWATLADPEGNEFDVVAG
jgi:catechol 2,3-dioxygenase-like lactoylglutathione lyase family enzyme